MQFSRDRRGRSDPYARLRPARARRTKISVFLEVEGAAHYLPAYAGNLDIMTSAALRVGERCALGPDACRPERRSMTSTAAVTSRTSPCAMACTRSATDHAGPGRRDRGALDAAGVDAIEVAHGDGLAGGSVNYGPGSNTDWDWIEAAAKHRRKPVYHPAASGHRHDRRSASAPTPLGVRSVRVATHCTEADVSAQHIATARELGMDVSGFLMMCHMAPPRRTGPQAKLMESYGAHCVYVTDSGGGLTMDGVRERVDAYREVLDPATADRHPRPPQPLARRGQLAWSPSKRASTRVDASLAGQGAGRGQYPIEAFIAVAELGGWQHGCDLFALQDAADDLVRPLQDRPVRVDRETLTLGYAGVYSSFLRHAERAAKRYGSTPRPPARGRPARPGRRPGGHDRRRRPRHRCGTRARRKKRRQRLRS